VRVLAPGACLDGHGAEFLRDRDELHADVHRGVGHEPQVKLHDLEADEANAHGDRSVGEVSNPEESGIVRDGGSRGFANLYERVSRRATGTVQDGALKMCKTRTSLRESGRGDDRCCEDRSNQHFSPLEARHHEPPDA
jgi:hypothetical protein